MACGYHTGEHKHRTFLSSQKYSLDGVPQELLYLVHLSFQSLAWACPLNFLLFSSNILHCHSFLVFDPQLPHLTQVLCHDGVCEGIPTGNSALQFSNVLTHLLLPCDALRIRKDSYIYLKIFNQWGTVSESTSNLSKVVCDPGHLPISGTGFFSWFVLCKSLFQSHGLNFESG